MKRTYLKTLWRTFSKHKARFLSLVLIVLVSIGFIAGIGSTRDKICYSLTEYYKERNVSDLIVKSTSNDGFSEDDLASLKDIYGANNVYAFTCVDVPVGEKRSVRYYFIDFDDWNINTYGEVKEGVAPSDKTQILSEKADNVIVGKSAGEKMTLDFKEIITKVAEGNGVPLDTNVVQMLNILKPVELTVSGVIQSPLTFANDGEPSYNNPEDMETPDVVAGTKDMDLLENIFFLSAELIPTYKDAVPLIPDAMNKPFLAKGDAFVTFGDRELYSEMSKEYTNYAEEQKQLILNEIEDCRVLTLRDNFSFTALNSYADKVEAIGFVIMVAFLAVTVLVTFSNMTRLLEEERSQIACLKTLGYSSSSVIFKYMLFALIATGAGGAGAYFIGLGLTYLLYYVFNFSFAMPPATGRVAVLFYFITLFLVVVGTTCATAFSGYKLANERPASLLRPKPPKAGKKVILEHVPLLWNRLSFKYKSTLRNVLRYKSRFFMTVIAVAVSMALVMAGLALLDMCLFGELDMPAIIGVALVVVIFAGLLTAVVVYTLTNINVSERKREIATLMVLGYTDNEVAGYIYREIYINSAVGIVFGYPAAALLIWGVFKALAFGSLSGVSWFMWLIAPVIVLLFTGLVTLLLRRKIVRVDMNDSLKAVE